VVVAALGDQARTEGFKLISELRRQGVAAQMDLLGRGLKSQMKYADRVGARYVVIMGEEELAKKTAIVRDMKLGDQAETSLSSVTAYILTQVNHSETDI